MNYNFLKSAWLILLAGLTACASDDNVITGCAPENGMTPVCELQSPEDFAHLPQPHANYLLLSQMGGMGAFPGSILLFDTVTRQSTQLYPLLNPAVDPTMTDSVTALDGGAWGDDACVEAPNATFSPHGTHLQRLDSGRWRYLVVNHGDRESVELFEVSEQQGQPSIKWRGCVLAPESTVINDVVGLANGDVVYTRMFAKNDTWSLLKSMMKIDTGEAWYWNKAVGLKALPGSQGAMPNGIELSPDQRHVFINMYMNEQVLKYNLAERRVVGSANVGMTDNSAWAPNGELWLVTHRGKWQDSVACFENPRQSCGLAFAVVAMNPDTMQHRTVFEHRGSPMGAATIAMQVGDEVFLGSYAGDRLLIVPANKFKD